MRRNKLFMISLTLALFSVLLSPAVVHADTFTVTNTNDSGPGSLRAAIDLANANPDPDTIQFNIPGCSGVCTIQLNSSLPSLTDDATTIDGYSQPGAAPATSSQPAAILIAIDGSHAGESNGLAITSAGNEIRGLAITNFDWDGIFIITIDAINNIVAGNYIGIDPAGNAASNGYSGVFIGQGAHRNTIGGEHPADRNILSGNAWSGIELQGMQTQLNIIGGNYIGVSPSGNASVPNSRYGVHIHGRAAGNFIGEYRNIISGNGQHGVAIVGERSNNNNILKNYIGTTADGMSALGNGQNGVSIENGAQDNLIFRNVIAANDHNGVTILSAPGLTETSGNNVEDNTIGVAADGITPLGNAQTGVWISYLGQHNVIGINIIAHNGADGVHVDTPTAFSNAIWINSIYNNGGLGIRLTNGANGEMIPPLIYNVDLAERVVSGATCSNCTVQIFANPDNDGEGQTFLGHAEAGPAGDFVVTFTSLQSG